MFQSDFFPDRETSSTIPLAFAMGEQISRRLADGCHLNRLDIAEFFAAQTGVQDWGSAWTIDDYNNAVEIGALLWLREFSRVDLDTGFHEAAAQFDWLEAALPPRHVRSEGQVELQQFSTPPILAWLMAKAASLSLRDNILEPSAGNGALALWGDVRGCSLTLNEIDRARRDALAPIFPRARLSAHDGELIAELANGPSPSVILINPPFARSCERGVDGRTAMRHLRSALRICASGGRLVAILPEGFDAATFVEDQKQASLLLNVRLSGVFSRSGTGIAVRMVVIEKVDLQDNSTISEEFADLAELNSCLAHLPDRAPLQAKAHRLAVRSVATSVSGSASRKPVAPFVTKAAQESAAVPLDYQALDEPAPVPEQAGIYLPYRPSRVIMQDA
ncbi:MAG: methylase, partial [Pseudomonadota bacterium]